MSSTTTASGTGKLDLAGSCGNVIYGVTAHDLATDHAKKHASARSRDA